MEKLEAEIRNFQVKCPLIKEPLNTRNMLTFIVGHELWHAKFRFSSTLKEEKLSEIREIIGTIYNEVNTQTFREKIALDGVFNYLNRTKILEELACDKYSIIEFFNNSIPKDLPSDKIVSLAELLVRVIAMRQYPTNISLACNFKLNKDGFLQYRDIHRADITRIGLATSAVCECLIDYLDKTFVEKFKKEAGKTGADWDSAPEETGTLLMMQS